MDYIQCLDYVYYCVFFQFLTVKELSNQHICFKGIMSSEFGSKNWLLWKRGCSFVSTEDENLWNPSRTMWFDESRLPKRSM